APSARTSASSPSAVSTFCGHGMPCAMSVDSNATSGRPAASASATSPLVSTTPLIAAAARTRSAGAPSLGWPPAVEAPRAERAWNDVSPRNGSHCGRRAQRNRNLRGNAGIGRLRTGPSGNPGQLRMTQQRAIETEDELQQVLEQLLLDGA